MPPASSSGLTLIEVLIVIFTLAVALTTLLGSYFWQLMLGEHSRNLGLAVHDANRVVEQLRRQNVGGLGCPLSVIPVVGTSWDAWLADTSANGGGGKSFPVNPAAEERIAVTCVRRDAPTPPVGADYCGRVDQVGAGEWHAGLNTADTNYDPLRVTVTVCWRHRGRAIGECTWNGTSLVANDANANGVIESPVMVTTLVTCKG